jgi:ribosome-associated protein
MTDDEKRPPPYTVDAERLKREIRIDTYRAAGPGGQHVNKTDSTKPLLS